MRAKRGMFRAAVICVLAALAGLSGNPAGMGMPPAGQAPVLAKIVTQGPLTRLGLPIFASWPGPDDAVTALVIAPQSGLETSGLGYQILDSPADPKSYVIATRPRWRRHARESLLPPSSLHVLLDDGVRVIARASEDQAEALAVSGFNIVRFPSSPVRFRPAPEALLAAPQAIVANPAIQAMMDEATSAAALMHDGNLSGVSPVTISGAPYTITTRHTRSGTPIAKATQYVYELLQGYGLSVSFQSWTAGSVSGRNVIGAKAGSTLPGEVVLVTAHIDDMPSSGAAPGADDNASGCAAVLLAAEIMAKRQFERTIRFVFFTGEEQGLYGSAAYAAACAAAGENIVAVLNLDMIAWDSSGGPVANLYLRPTSTPGYAGDFKIADTFAGVVAAYGLSAKLTPVNIADGSDWSDHSSFWNEGYPAIVVIEDDWNDFNPYYHTANDLLARLNGAYMGHIIKASIGTIAHLASPIGTARITLSKTSLAFGAAAGGQATKPQRVVVSISGGDDIDWTATSNKSWLTAAPSSGLGSGTVTVSVDISGLPSGTYTGAVAIASGEASNSPQSIAVTLRVWGSGVSAGPFGSFDTPANNATVMSSIAVTGWALDDVEVSSVKIYRNPVGAEGGTRIYIGDGTFIEGSRPDVEAIYPSYPLSYRSGWGYMLLTNFMPGGGNGTFTLYAYATDKDGHEVLIGSKTITCDNLHAVKPFGAIDTPTQGGEISGALYYNFGWALTPMPNLIPTDGSTLGVWIDGEMVGRPQYNNFRDDIAALFPGYANSNGAVGVFDLDTTAYENGMHNIAWSVEDNAGNVDGIGSRFFWILNTSSPAPQGQAERYGEEGGRNLIGAGTQGFLTRVSDLTGFADRDGGPVYIRRGFDRSGPPESVVLFKPDTLGKSALRGNSVVPRPGEGPLAEIKIRELERIEILLDDKAWASDADRRMAERAGVAPPATSGKTAPKASIPQNEARWEGYLIVGDELRRLPIGSTLDTAVGVFSWLPGPGFLGDYRLVFIDRASRTRVEVTVKIK